VLFDSLKEASRVQRIESQPMLLDPLPECGARSFERLLMKRNTTVPPPCGKKSTRCRLEPWHERHIESAAAALWLSHIGHIDNQISDQYRSFAGALRFVQELVRFPGSATFCPASSYVAFDQDTRQVAGVCLAVQVADQVAHIAELCVIPQSRGSGVGYELLHQSITSLGSTGAQRISLTVTASNDRAIRLYSGFGFHVSRRFHAYAWERSAAAPLS
jgi:ribosomal protein S18 acetylase RimI-like enzyme